MKKAASFIGKMCAAIMILFVLSAPFTSSTHAIYSTSSSIPPATVFLSPYRVQGTKGAIVTVNLGVSDVTDFLTGQAGLIWTNITAVGGVSIALGSFLTPVSKTSFIPGDIDNTTGIIGASLFSMLGRANNKNGSGTFLTFTFQMLQTGYSDLYIQNMFLTAKDGVTLIPFNTIDHFTVVRAGSQYDVELMGNPSWSNSYYWGGYYNGSVTAVSQVIGTTTYKGQLSFNINGTADDFGSFAYFNVTIPNNLMNCTSSGQWQIELNGGSAVAPTHINVGTANTTISLEFAYTETPQTAQIFSTNIAGARAPLTVSISPTSVTMGVGQSNLFTSTVSGGTSPYTYQWYLNGTSVPGATSATWTFTPSSSGSYTVYVNATDKAGNKVKSNVAMVTVTTTVNLHDVAVTNVTPSKTVVGQGFSDSINVTAANKGSYAETFKVTVYANATSVTSQNITLSIGHSDATTFVWNTKGFAYGSYTIKIQVTLTPGETNTSNNTYTDGIVKVTIPGDVNGDGFVNQLDVALIVSNWLKTVPPAPANADINGDGRIMSTDFAIIAANWQQP